VRRTVIRSRSMLSLSENVSPAELLASLPPEQLGDFDRAAAGFSPDRCDALVWAFSELMVEPMAGQGFYDLAREHAEAFEARKAQAEEAARIVPDYAVGSLEYAEQQRRIAEGRE
jgi:hypothetical protein